MAEGRVDRYLRLFGTLAIVLLVAFGVRAALRALFPPPPIEGIEDLRPKASPFRVADEAVGNRLERSYVFTDQDGNIFDLAGWFDKPLIISYIFTSCPEVCPAINTSLSRIVRDNKERLGRDFRIVSVGFDVKNDTVDTLRRYGEGFTDSFDSWKFVTGAPETIAALADRIGIMYRPANGSWEHTVGVTIIAPGGYVYKQIFGPTYSTKQIMDPVEGALKEAAEAAKAARKTEE